VIDHIGISCADYPKSQVFYDTLLGVLGFSRQMDFGEAIGYFTVSLAPTRCDPDGNNVEAVCHHA
jgi:catechol 2,3-dioxygenase-like lactoylglutathione lyase family enzyme